MNYDIKIIPEIKKNYARHRGRRWWVFKKNEKSETTKQQQTNATRAHTPNMARPVTFCFIRSIDDCFPKRNQHTEDVCLTLIVWSACAFAKTWRRTAARIVFFLLRYMLLVCFIRMKRCHPSHAGEHYIRSSVWNARNYTSHCRKKSLRAARHRPGIRNSTTHREYHFVCLAK